MDYKSRTTYHTRISLSRKITEKYYEKIPIIVESYNTPYFIQKMITPRSMRLSEFIKNISNKIDSKKTSILLTETKRGFIILSPNKTMGEIYDEHKCNDDFLYFRYTEENTFG